MGGGGKSWKNKNRMVVQAAGPVNTSVRVGNMYSNPLGKVSMSANEHRNIAYLSQITGTSLTNPNTKASQQASQLEKSAASKIANMGMASHRQTMKNYSSGFVGNTGLAYKHNPNFNFNLESKRPNNRKYTTAGEYELGFVKGNPLQGHNQRIKYKIFNPDANYTNNPFNNPAAFGKRLGSKSTNTYPSEGVLVLNNNHGPVNTHL